MIFLCNLILLHNISSSSFLSLSMYLGCRFECLALYPETCGQSFQSHSLRILALFTFHTLTNISNPRQPPFTSSTPNSVLQHTIIENLKVVLRDSILNSSHRATKTSYRHPTNYSTMDVPNIFCSLVPTPCYSCPP